MVRTHGDENMQTGKWMAYGMILLMTLAVFAGIVTAVTNTNVPDDDGNGNFKPDDVWENDRLLCFWETDYDADIADFGVAATDVTIDSGDCDTVIINGNLTISATYTLTFEGVDIIMNGTSNSWDGTQWIKIYGQLILINSTITVNATATETYDIIVYGDDPATVNGRLIVDNSSIEDCNVLKALPTASGNAYIYAFNSNINASILELHAIAGPKYSYMYTVNTVTDFLGGVTVDTGSLWMNGYQHFLTMPGDADMADRVITIEDYYGNTTQKDWTADSEGGIDFADYLHMPSDPTEYVLTFGTVEFSVYTTVALAQDQYFNTSYIDVVNGTTALNVTVDLPDVWVVNQIEFYNHTTASTIRYQNGTTELPFFESDSNYNPPGHNTPDTGRTRGVGAVSGREIEFPLDAGDSGELVHAGITVSAGIDKDVCEGSVVNLTATATQSRGGLLFYTWSFYHNGSLLFTRTGASISQVANASLPAGEYDVKVRAFNRGGSYDDDWMVLTVESCGGGGTTTTETDDDGYDWGANWYDILDPHWWGALWDCITGFFGGLAWYWWGILIVLLVSVIIYMRGGRFNKGVKGVKRNLWG
jgi:hypothetical protein